MCWFYFYSILATLIIVKVQESKAAYSKISTLVKAYLGEAPLISKDDFWLKGQISANVVRSRSPSDLQHTCSSCQTSLRYIFAVTDFVTDMNAYLSALVSSPVRTLEELIQFNVDHADVELPSGVLTPRIA